MKGTLRINGVTYAAEQGNRFLGAAWQFQRE
jgi:hypothetical protein